MATLSAPTLQKLITNTRSMLNSPNPNNSFWTDRELTEWINDGIRMYFNEVIMNDEGAFETQTDLNIVTDTETVALPTDFFKLKAVYKKVNTGYILLPYRNNLTESYSTQGGTSANNYTPYYYFRGNNLVLRPVPNFSETAGLRIEYTQFPETLVNGGDALTNQLSPIFKTIVEMHAVYKAKLKESLVNGATTYTPAAQNLSALFAQFKDAISQRSKNPIFVIPFNPEADGQ